MYLLLAFAYQYIEWHIPFLIPFSTVNNISISVKIPNFTLFFKATCHAKPFAIRKRVGSSSYISREIF